MGSDTVSYLQISGIYPHLATFNQPDDVADRPNHGECGTGAIVWWANRLWYITYCQHKTTGSNDKLYEVDAAMNLTLRPESVGGTHACRMVHRESNQLIIGPYFIDTKGHVRTCDLQKLRGRMTAVMRHLTDPVNKVYFFDMEGAIYEVDVHSLQVTRLFAKPVPGWHGKGGYTAQGRVVIANNGESGPPEGLKSILVGGPAVGEEAGVLAEWDGTEWRIVERKQFTDVTGPGDILGSPSDDSPLWAIGWDKRSVILKLLDGGQWYTFRLPKASHTFDPRHGWFTEWPRIREIGDGRPMMCMHGSLIDFPAGFRAEDTSGLRPLATHLRYIPDFCAFNGGVVLGADDASMMQNPMCGQGQSNLWFGTAEALRHFGPRAGWGGVWVGDAVKAGEASVPYLFAGYAQRVLHLAHDGGSSVRFDIEIGDGRGGWAPYKTIEVPAQGYGFHVFPQGLGGEWVRLRSDHDCTATAYFHYWSPRPEAPGEERLFDAPALAEAPAGYAGGLIRPAAHNRSLQWLRQTVSAEGQVSAPEYIEVDLEGRTGLAFTSPPESRADEMLKVAQVREDFAVDGASVIVTRFDGRRFRLPKGPAVFDRPLPTGRARGIRECVSERYLANLHGTFYEIPRESGGGSRPDFERMKPVASHGKLITDFCTWRGLLVLAGARLDAEPDGQFLAGSDGAGLWFGTIDDLWKLGKPVGRGGPWRETAVKAGEPSDPYLMTGYDRKRLALSHDVDAPVTFTVELDFDHTGFRPYAELSVEPGRRLVHDFPAGFHAHWVRLTVDQDCTATATLLYQ